MNEDSIEGMTVNERLSHFNLFESFDNAARSQNLAVLVEVLIQARFSEEQANHTASALLANPKLYGF